MSITKADLVHILTQPDSLIDNFGMLLLTWLFVSTRLTMHFDRYY